MNCTSCSIWLFLVTKFIYLLSKAGPVSRWNCYCTFFVCFIFITLWPQLHKADSGNCRHIARILWRSGALPQTTYRAANWMAQASVMESRLPAVHSRAQVSCGTTVFTSIWPVHSVVTKPAYLTSGQTGPKDQQHSDVWRVRLVLLQFHRVPVYVCKSPWQVHLHVHVLKHHCTFWLIFGSFLQSRAPVLPSATLPSLCGLSRNNCGFPSVSLCTAGTQPAVWLCVESCFLSSWLTPSEEPASKARGCTCSFFQHSKAVPLQVWPSRSSEGASLFLP